VTTIIMSGNAALKLPGVSRALVMQKLEPPRADDYDDY
jgi:hypothetical protein